MAELIAIFATSRLPLRGATGTLLVGVLTVTCLDLFAAIDIRIRVLVHISTEAWKGRGPFDACELHSPKIPANR